MHISCLIANSILPLSKKLNTILALNFVLHKYEVVHGQEN